MKQQRNNALLGATRAVLATVASLAFATAANAAAHHAARLPSTDALPPQVDATPFLNTSRMVTYTWTPDRSYVVRTVAGVYTVITMPAGEKIQGFYLSQATDWHYIVTDDHRRVLIQPASAGLYNTALLVTDKHSYQLTIASAGPSDLWFQSVTWNIPGQGQPASGAYWTPNGQAADGSTTDPGAGGGGSDPASINPASLYFKYSIKGEASFRPTTVFDDGARTWLKFDSHAQDLPAIFGYDDGKLDVLNYSVAHGYVIIPRVEAKLELRLNGRKVVIERGCDPSRCLR